MLMNKSQKKEKERYITNKFKKKDTVQYFFFTSIVNKSKVLIKIKRIHYHFDSLEMVELELLLFDVYDKWDLLPFY
jgi:hypothetical protein